MAIRAYAKVNLSLAISGFTPDGFHNLDSIVTAVSLYDTVELRASLNGKNSVTYTDGRKYDADNALHTLDALCAEYGAPTYDCVITKRIPEGVGLGGSSADAAGIIRAVSDSNGFRVSQDFALSCGSDVPSLLFGGAKRITGRGCVAETIDVPELYMTLVYGKERVSTAEAFRMYDEIGGDTGNASDYPNKPFNSLERASIAVNGKIKKYRQILIDAGYDRIVMTGSGSGFIGFTTDGKAHEICLKKAIEHATCEECTIIELTNVKDYI